MSAYKVIDVKNWKRAVQCEVFRNSMQPQYGVSLELDITNFLRVIQAKGYSFTFSFVYIVSKCANECEEFRYRFQDGEVVLYERIDTSFTYMDADGELFKVVNVPMKDSLDEYVKAAGETAGSQQAYFTGPMGNDIFQFSSMPWISFTHISHTYSGNKEAATPLFDWGKYFERDGKIILPFSVQVHHSFVDGIHIAKFADLLQACLDEME